MLHLKITKREYNMIFDRKKKQQKQPQNVEPLYCTFFISKLPNQNCDTTIEARAVVIRSSGQSSAKLFRSENQFDEFGETSFSKAICFPPSR